MGLGKIHVGRGVLLYKCQLILLFFKRRFGFNSRVVNKDMTGNSVFVGHVWPTLDVKKN